MSTGEYEHGPMVTYIGMVKWDAVNDDGDTGTVNDGSDGIVTELYYMDGWFYYHTNNDPRFPGLLVGSYTDPVFHRDYAKCTLYELSPILDSLYEGFLPDIKDPDLVRSMIDELTQRAEWATVNDL